jgi:hypothetical protein
MIVTPRPHGVKAARLAAKKVEKRIFNAKNRSHACDGVQCGATCRRRRAYGASTTPMARRDIIPNPTGFDPERQRRSTSKAQGRRLRRTLGMAVEFIDANPNGVPHDAARHERQTCNPVGVGWDLLHIGHPGCAADGDPGLRWCNAFGVGILPSVVSLLILARRVHFVAVKE